MSAADLAVHADMLAWIDDTPDDPPTSYTVPGLVAAGHVLATDPDGGAGRPDLIRQAAQAARDAHDEPLAEWIDAQAAGWDRYLSGLAAALR